MKMNNGDMEAFRKRLKFVIPSMKKSEIVKHFEKEGIPRSTIYANIERLQSGGSIEDNERNGRPTSWTATRLNQLKKLTNNRKGVSQRRLARKFRVHQTTICRGISKLKISCHKREKTAKYSEKQAEKAKNISKKLANFLYGSSHMIILDDEKFFTFEASNMPGNAYYYTDDKSKCPDGVRFAGKEKFPKKIMVWIAVSSRGLSKPNFRVLKSEATNSDVYINECLIPRLVPFIRHHHSDNNYVFWPDLARAHYSKETVAWMNENVKYVPEHLNPPNVTQARPIESFWGDLAQKVYEGGWEATTEEELIRRIKSKIKDFNTNYLETLMAGVKAKVRSIGENGVYSLFK